MTRQPGSDSVAGKGPLRALAWTTLAFLAVAAGLLSLSYRGERGAAPSEAVSLRTALLGRGVPARASSQAEQGAAERAAGARAGLVLAALVYGLVAGLLAGPVCLRGVCLSLLVLSLGLPLLELATELLGLHQPALPRPTEANRQISAYDATKGWFHVPGGIGSASLGDDAAIVHIDSLGRRGPEVSVLRTPGVARVLVLGDSFAFGMGVDEGSLFSTRLGEFLEADGGGPTEVVNMGVLGYATDQELILFEELGMRLSPDVVVLVACDNDFEGNLLDFVYRRYYKPWFSLGEDGERHVQNLPVPRLDRWQRAKLYLGQRSNLWNLARNHAPWGDRLDVARAHRSDEDPIVVTAALIRALDERVGAAEGRLLVVNTGHRGERTALFQALRPRLQGVAQMGLEGVLGDARRAAPYRAWDFPDDTHWNRDSHALAARAVAGHLLRTGLLPHVSARSDHAR